MAIRYSDYERGSYGRHYADEEDRGYESRGREYGGERRDDRGFIDRARDEVRSWFGDEEDARRHNDERRRGPDGRHHPRSESRIGGGVRARNLMTRDVVTVQPFETVERAARMMRDCDCGSLPVVDRGGRLIGMITDRDITMRLVARGGDIRRAVVDDCMTDEVFACHADDSIEGCMRTMSRHQVRRVPIVDDRGHVVGIVSQGDLVQHAGRHPGRGERRAMADVLCAVSEPTPGSHR